MKEKILVLGGGISGLSVGVNALLNGYDVTILEKNYKAGGCCGAFERDGYLIDHCIHWLIGSDINSQQAAAWKKLHAFDENTKFFRLEDLITIEYDNKIYRLSRDYEKSYKELIDNAPEDLELIDEFFGYVRRAMKMYLKVDFKTFFKNFSHAKGFLKSCNIDRIEFANKFKNEGMKRLFTNAQNGYCNLMFFLFEYVFFINDNANIPEGGSHKFMENILNYYLELGGEIKTNTEVEKIIVENKSITKVIAKNEEYIADHYVCTFNPYYALNSLFDKKYVDKELIKRDKIAGDTAPSVTQVSFTVDADISSWPTPFGIESNIKVGTHTFNTMMLRSYAYDKDLYVKNGKTVVNILFDQNKYDYEYYKSLSKDEYENEKKRIEREVFETIENRFKELKGKLKLLEIITPLSMEKWTNSLYGAYQSFSCCKESKFFYHTPQINAINNFYMVGIWMLSPGGLPVAGQAGDLLMPFIKHKHLDKTLSVIGIN